MRRVVVLSVFLVSMALFVARRITAQEYPVAPAPMAPIAQWPPATPWAPPPDAGDMSQTWTTPPQPNVDTSSTRAQILGTDNFGGGLDSVYGMPTGQESLADAAREARQRLARDHPRVFTNDDIARLRHAAGEPPLGIAPSGRPVTNEQTMPASDQTTPHPAAPNTTNPNNAPNKVQNNAPTSDQTTPPAPGNQTPPKRSPFGSK